MSKEKIQEEYAEFVDRIGRENKEANLLYHKYEKFIDENHGYINVNYKEAENWLIKAADQGLLIAQYALSQEYGMGQYFAYDPVRREFWLNKAKANSRELTEYFYLKKAHEAEAERKRLQEEDVHKFCEEYKKEQLDLSKGAPVKCDDYTFLISTFLRRIDAVTAEENSVSDYLRIEDTLATDNNIIKDGVSVAEALRRMGEEQSTTTEFLLKNDLPETTNSGVSSDFQAESHTIIAN